MKRRPRIGLAAALVAASTLLPVAARADAAAIAAGRAIATASAAPDRPGCATCHMQNGAGQPDAGIPQLAGLRASYLAAQLGYFAGGGRDNAIMKPLAAALTAAQRQAVAEYYASLPVPPTTAAAPAPPERLARGQALFFNGDYRTGLLSCALCHGRTGLGVGTFSPRIAGQSAAYSAAQLAQWQAGKLRDPDGAFMRAVAAHLTQSDIAAVAAFAAAAPIAFAPPPDDAVPAGKFGDVVRRGERIFRDTDIDARRFVGNRLRCSNCHLQGGRLADSAPMGAAYTAYPAYRSKNGHVNSFEERLQGCFRFSMNGRPPPLGDPVLVALETYSYFLAKGLPTGIDAPGRGYPALPKPPLPANYARGAQVYARHCALCHGPQGGGQSSGGAVVFPPLWGPQSYDWGAGIASIKTAAAFIHANMPLAQAGTLGVQQAWDAAAYIDSQVRPQDPRFIGNVAATRQKFHDSPFSMYGQTVNGAVLGDPAATSPFGTVPGEDKH